MNLKLSFEKPEQRQLTDYEINELSMAAHGISALARVMVGYAMDNPRGEEDDGLGVYCAVFNVLQWLIEPIDDYLFEFAGKPATKDAAKDAVTDIAGEGRTE
jgi:hypothetical protein